MAIPGWAGAGRTWILGRGAEQFRRGEVLSTMQAFSGLPLNMSPEAKRELGAGVEAAASRNMDLRLRLFSQLRTPLIFLLTFPFVSLGFFSSRRVGYFTMALLFTLGLGLIRKAIRHRTLTAKVLTVNVTVLMSYLWVLGFRTPQNRVAVPSIPLAGILCGLFVTLPVFVSLLWTQRRRVRRLAHPNDDLVPLAVAAAATLHDKRESWYSAQVCREWCRRLEILAVEAQFSLAAEDRVDRAEIGLRREMREDARRVAEVMRSQKRVLQRARGVQDVDEMVQSLIVCLKALVENDWTTLLENAEPAPSGASRFRRLVVRALPGLTLVAIGLLLPHFPGLGHRNGVADGQLMLVISGATWVATASNEAAGQVRDVLGKLLPFK